MDGGFPPMSGFPPMGSGFPMPDSIPGFPDGFPPMGEGFSFGDDFPMMPGFGNAVVGMFAAYRVSSYQEEIQILKKWLASRLSFLDRNISRFDKDWEPHIQEPKEIKAPQFGGGFPFAFPAF
jgi:hypothetical protein